LKLLVDHGLLIPDRDRKSRTYRGSQWLKDIRSQFREPQSVPDPFAGKVI